MCNLHDPLAVDIGIFAAMWTFAIIKKLNKYSCTIVVINCKTLD